ncbi:response regulator [Reinekea blandensis]|uniref:Response regulator n=1 Tax=Reinekea blandensis MED297 TaxID=314283 RepID=A4BER3_9GAMM|nr:response regulator [Reinekea blandensis]EAR09490.1 Response regulator [Reinekea sp. MED297] [Reinekea blandensis MED297]
MQPNSTSILIVDDTKFSSAVVNKALKNDGFTDIRVADNAIDALSMMKERSVDILIADWLMPGMDGLELTQLVRELNRRQNHFSYVVLLTAKEENDDLKEAFAKGVDDFVGKTTLKSHLLPRIHAAQRMARLQNSLLRRELALKEQFRGLTLMNRIDPTTGVGNLQFLEQQLGRYLKQHRGRSGSIGLLLCRLDNLPELKLQHGEALKNRLVKQAAERLQEAARPMDDVARIDENTLALALYGREPNFITHALVRRIQEALLIRAYPTDNGYCTLEGSIQYDVIDANGHASAVQADEVIQAAMQRLSDLPAGQSVYFWEANQELA